MPAGVSWAKYITFSTAAFLSMMAGSQTVHYYYNPLKDLDAYIEKELQNHGVVSTESNKPNIR